MAVDLKGTPLTTTYRRVTPRPVDETSWWQTLEDAETYAANAPGESSVEDYCPYNRQLVAVEETGKLYMLVQDSQYYNDDGTTKDGKSGHYTLEEIKGGGEEADPLLSADSTKPIQSMAVYQALQLKQDLLRSGINIRTVNDNSLVGSGNVNIRSLFWRGTYDPSAAYTKDDVVYWTGSAFVATKARKGVAPITIGIGVDDTLNDGWEYLARRGASLTYSSLTSAQKKELAQDATTAATDAKKAVQDILDYIASLDPSTDNTVIAQVAVKQRALEANMAIIRALVDKLNGYIVEVNEDGLFVCDSQYNIMAKHDANGFDVAAISQHFRSLLDDICRVYEVKEDGWFVADNQHRSMVQFTSEGFDAAWISAHFKELLGLSDIKRRISRIEQIITGSSTPDDDDDSGSPNPPAVDPEPEDPPASTDTIQYKVGLISDAHVGASSSADTSGGLTKTKDAIDILKGQGATFCCFSGDSALSSPSAATIPNEISAFGNISKSLPTFCCMGNHDNGLAAAFKTATMTSRETSFATITTSTAYSASFAFSKGTDRYIFISMHSQHLESNPYTTGGDDLTWLQDQLNAYKSNRCFVFIHLPMLGVCGIGNGLLNSEWTPTSDHTRLKSIYDNSTNTVWITGHMHWEWSVTAIQHYHEDTSKKHCCISMPSVSKPRNSNRDTTSGSQGALMEVYGKKVVIRSYDFSSNKELTAYSRTFNI